MEQISSDERLYKKEEHVISKVVPLSRIYHADDIEYHKEICIHMVNMVSPERYSLRSISPIKINSIGEFDRVKCTFVNHEDVIVTSSSTNYIYFEENKSALYGLPGKRIIKILKRKRVY